MISKLGVGILLSVATLFFATPTNAFATSSADSAKIKKYFTQLKKLPNGMSPASKVNSLVVKLSKLDPKKAVKYYKTGLTKLATGPTANGFATRIAATVAKIVKQAGLPSKQIAQINQANIQYNQNPKNSSPSAMVESHRFMALA